MCVCKLGNLISKFEDLTLKPKKKNTKDDGGV